MIFKIRTNSKTKNLIELKIEFTAQRTAGIRRFPKALWQKAISFAKIYSIAEVCSAIKTPEGYLRRKMQIKPSQSLHFIQTSVKELPSYNQMTLSIETSRGHKLKIEGLTNTGLAPPLWQRF